MRVMRPLLPWILILSLWLVQWANGMLEHRKQARKAPPPKAPVAQKAESLAPETLVLREGIDRPVRVERVLIPSAHGPMPVYEVVVCRRPRAENCRPTDETLWFPLEEWEKEVNGSPHP